MSRSRRRSHHRSPAKPRRSQPLQRRIPTYELLSDAQLDLIEAHAERIGEAIGVEFRDVPEVLDLWRQAGASVEGELVKFPRGLLRDIITQNVQSEFIHHARNPERSVVIGGDHVVFAPNYGSPFVTDSDKGRRYATIEDFENIVKLTYMTPWLHHSGGTVCEPTDVPVSKRHLDMVYAHIRYSDKPFMGSVTSAERAQDSIDMAKIVFGEEFVQNHCVIMGNINVNSPLVFDATMLDALKVYAENNQCVLIVPFILTGAMGPVTIEAAVAQVLIESMAGVALTQLIRPGSPVIFASFTSSMSLRSGAPTFGMPEPALGLYAIGQLARRLGVPIRGGGSLTASKVSDYQAAQESADSLMPTLLSGTNFILHAAGWLEGGLSFGYEKFMLDCDHLGMMDKLLGGMTLDDEHLAMDAYQEIGPGNHYLGCAHTMRHYQTALHTPDLSDSESFEQWEEQGALDAVQRAHAAYKQALADYQAPEIDANIDAQLQDFIKKRKAEIPDTFE